MTTEELQTVSDEKLIGELASALERLWAGGGGFGVYTVSHQRDKLRPLLSEFMDRCRATR